jgi:glutathione S-transferase
MAAPLGRNRTRKPRSWEAMMSITLFEFGPTRSARARWTLLELGIPFESIAGLEVIGSPQLKAVSPLGKVPAIIEDGRGLFESAAICTWLADSHPEKGLIAPSGSWERALHDQWVSFCLAELEAHLWSTHRNTHLYPEHRRLPAVTEQDAAEGRRSLDVLNAHLAGTPFLVGGRFTVTDIIVGFAVNWARNLGWATGLAHCQAYNARLRAMPNCPYGDA